MQPIFGSHNSTINRFPNFVVKIVFNDLILTCTAFTKCTPSVTNRTAVGLRFFGLMSYCTCVVFSVGKLCKLCLSSVDFVSWIVEGHFSFSLSNRVLFEDDIMPKLVTETTTSKEKVPLNHDILFTWF